MEGKINKKARILTALLIVFPITAISQDGGHSWKVEDEGSSAQGGYYDTETGIRWRVSGYSLYQREIP